MFKIYSLLLAFLLSFTFFSQGNLVYTGKIGNFPIKLTIDSSNAETGAFYGKYNYAKKKTFLKLTGEYNPPTLYLKESFNNDTTADWYVEEIGDSIIGKWIGNGKSLAIRLVYKSGNKTLLKRKTELDFNKMVSEKISGKYAVNYNFINDMWVNEDNLYPEIGYNGGFVKIKELKNGDISFEIEMICGPTYHMAFSEGSATKESENNYLYKNEDGCEITFVFKDKKLAVKANESFKCGFGARAYLDHELWKVKD